ncbi:MAG: hypothetical protein NTY37_11685 [Methanothrix sp.]|nr:hypothetical protein [Methanothrix sp.]
MLVLFQDGHEEDLVAYRSKWLLWALAIISTGANVDERLIIRVSKYVAVIREIMVSKKIHFASIDDEIVSANSHTDRHISYKSDVDLSEDEIIQGLMEISAISLPDEPHKYPSSSRTRMKI